MHKPAFFQYCRRNRAFRWRTLVVPFCGGVVATFVPVHAAWGADATAGAPPPPATTTTGPDSPISLAIPPGGPGTGQLPVKATGTQGTPLQGMPSHDITDSVVLENADSLTQTVAGQWVARGNVRLHYRDYEMVADRADIDTDRGIVTFSGNVVLHGPNSEDVYGGPKGTVTINTNANTYEVTNAGAIIRKEALEVGILEPLYVSGGEISGRPDFIDARDSDFTTCDFPSPHYFFKAREVYVLPGKRLVGRHVTLYRRNRALVTLPYFFIPLDKRVSRQTLFPVIGQSPDEGYYAKFAVAYLLTKSLPGILQIDLMQKKGIGTGFTQDYGSNSNLYHGVGAVSLYHLKDQSLGADNFNGSLSHHQKFGTFDVAFNGQFQQNSYYLSDSRSKSISDQLNVTRNVGNLSDTLTANQMITDYGTGRSQTLTSALSQSFRPTQNENLQLRFNLTDTATSVAGASSTDTEQLDSNIEYDQRNKTYDFTFTANKYTQLKSTLGGQFFGGLERLPEVRLATDPERLSFLRRYLPNSAKLDFAIGDYIEPSTSTNLKRLHFGVDTGLTTIKVTKGQTLDLGGSYLQRFYSDDTAQYILTERTAYKIGFGKKSSVNLGYNYLRPYGYTPFQFDFSGNTNLASLNFNYQETRTFQLTATSGYDFNAARETTFGTPTPWQTLSVQSLWKPSNSFGVRSSTAFDPNHGQLVDLTNNFQIKGSDAFSVYLGTRYAPQQHEFANLNGQLDWTIITDRKEDAGYRVRAIGSYNGYTKQFEYQGLALTKLWHDWETSVIYQNNTLGATPGPTFTFNINLRALPSYEPFSIGNYGQAIDTGLGSTL